MKRLHVFLLLLLVVGLVFAIQGAALAAGSNDMGAIELNVPKSSTLTGTTPDLYTLTLDKPSQIKFDVIFDAPEMAVAVYNLSLGTPVALDAPKYDGAYPFKYSFSRPLGAGQYAVVIGTRALSSLFPNSYKITLRRTRVYRQTEVEPNFDNNAANNPMKWGKNTGMYTSDDPYDAYVFTLTEATKVKFTLNITMSEGGFSLLDQNDLGGDPLFLKMVSSSKPGRKILTSTMILKPGSYMLGVVLAGNNIAKPGVPGLYTLTAAKQKMPSALMTLPKSITIGAGCAMGPDHDRELPVGVMASSTNMDYNLVWSVPAEYSEYAEVDANGNVVAKEPGTSKLVLTDTLANKSVSTKLIVKANEFGGKPLSAKQKSVYISVKSAKFDSAGNLTGQLYALNKTGRAITGYTDFLFSLSDGATGGDVTNLPTIIFPKTFAKPLKNGRAALIDFTIPKASLRNDGVGLDLTYMKPVVGFVASPMFTVPAGSVKAISPRDGAPGVGEEQNAELVLQPGQRAR